MCQPPCFAITKVDTLFSGGCVTIFIFEISRTPTHESIKTHWERIGVSIYISSTQLRHLIDSEANLFEMATKNSKPQQQKTTFQIIEPLFYTEFNTEYPVFNDWTLERIPRKFNIRRIIYDGYKTSCGWHYESYNTKGKFRCIKCTKAGVQECDATWSSAYTTVLFRAYHGPDTDEFGQTWIGRWVQMKIFAQQCKTCGEYITAELDDKQAVNLVKWLHRWIANIFHGFPYYGSVYRGRETNRNHLESRCEACASGWCHYLKVKHLHIKKKKD